LVRIYSEKRRNKVQKLILPKNSIWVAYIIVALLVLLIRPIIDLLTSGNFFRPVHFGLYVNTIIFLFLHKELSCFSISSIYHFGSGAFYSQSSSSLANWPSFTFYKNNELLSSLSQILTTFIDINEYPRFLVIFWLIFSYYIPLFYRALILTKFMDFTISISTEFTRSSWLKFYVSIIEVLRKMIVTMKMIIFLDFSIGKLYFDQKNIRITINLLPIIAKKTILDSENHTFQ